MDKKCFLKFFGGTLGATVALWFALPLLLQTEIQDTGDCFALLAIVMIMATVVALVQLLINFFTKRKCRERCIIALFCIFFAGLAMYVELSYTPSSDANTVPDSDIVSSEKSTDECPEYVSAIFYRFLEWQKEWQKIYESQYIEFQGPLVKNSDFWVFNVELKTNGFGLSRQVRFYCPNGGEPEHSFSVSFDKDNIEELNDYVAAMIYVIADNLSVEECITQKDDLINSYVNGMSDIYDGNDYKAYISEENVVSGYHVACVYKTEQNQAVNPALYTDVGELNYDDLLQGTSELSTADILFKFEGTVDEYVMNYPTVTIAVHDDVGNSYAIGAVFDQTLNDITEGEKLTFFVNLAKVSNGNAVHCNLNYYEPVIQ